ncbi:hypothetical protein LINPERHAP2_LOCUS36055 [Linum perenne]
MVPKSQDQMVKSG